MNEVDVTDLIVLFLFNYTTNGLIEILTRFSVSESPFERERMWKVSSKTTD